MIIAPEFEPEGRALLQKKKNLRLMKMLSRPDETQDDPDVRSVIGGVLVQEKDGVGFKEPERHVVSARPPSADEMKAMLFGWRVVKHIKSNAIVYASKDRTLGIGAGQMARVDAARIAVWKANEAGLTLKGSAVCSDAFFPFADGLIAAADAGATAAIQPGGSLRDEEVIAAANERQMAMVFTGSAISSIERKEFKTRTGVRTQEFRRKILMARTILASNPTAHCLEADQSRSTGWNAAPHSSPPDSLSS